MIFNIFSQNLRAEKKQLDNVVYLSEVTVSLSEEMATTHCS